MTYQIRDRVRLKQILWLDTLAGGVTAIIGITQYGSLGPLLGLTTPLILLISGVTLLYAVIAFVLVNQGSTSIVLLRLLIRANWLWSLISLVLFLLYYRRATPIGITFLVLQVVVVGVLAYVEGQQVVGKQPTLD